MKTRKFNPKQMRQAQDLWAEIYVKGIIEMFFKSPTEEIRKILEAVGFTCFYGGLNMGFRQGRQKGRTLKKEAKEMLERTKKLQKQVEIQIGTIGQWQELLRVRARRLVS